jgi:hypothetical protein
MFLSFRRFEMLHVKLFMLEQKHANEKKMFKKLIIENAFHALEILSP